jgi:biopolymer transport protein ExbB
MGPGELVSTLIASGGISGWILILLAILAVVVAIERALALSRASIDLNEFLARVRKALVTNQSIREAIKACEEFRGPAPSIVKAGLLRYGHPRDEIAHTLAAATLFETGRLERRLPVLKAIARSAPLIGFLGAALGAIRALDQVAGGSVNGSGPIAAAIETALVPAVAGLLVGLLALVAHVWARSRADRARREVETAASMLLETLGEMAYGGAAPAAVGVETGREVPTR